ncbi:MAG: hypothetical protein RLY86_3658 [Pseudomonadota bacterium]|jgi:hypothetical protein
MNDAEPRIVNEGRICLAFPADWSVPCKLDRLPLTGVISGHLRGSKCPDVAVASGDAVWLIEVTDYRGSADDLRADLNVPVSGGDVKLLNEARWKAQDGLNVLFAAFRQGLTDPARVCDRMFSDPQAKILFVLLLEQDGDTKTRRKQAGRSKSKLQQRLASMLKPFCIDVLVADCADIAGAAPGWTANRCAGPSP